MSATVRRGRSALAVLAASAMMLPQAGLAADPHQRTCTKTIHVPAVTKTVHEQVVIPGGTVETIVPPQMRTTTRRIVIQSPRERIFVHAPRYDHVTTKVRTPDRIVQRHVPPRTKRVREKVMIAPARTVHKPCVKHGHHTTCAVHLPAQYGYRPKSVVTQPARVEHRRVSGRTRYAEQRVLVQPGALVRLHEPTQYASVHVSTPEVPQHLRRRHIPARHTTVAREVVVSPGHTRTVHVPCGD